ncbi:MAG: hypothetical protein M3R38_05210 [Actinomycetota bacterium]|nr:hypothetical protein [Actinomycetota bacterium]
MPTFNEVMQRPDPVLSQIVIGHENEDTVGHQLAPVIPVNDRKGQFPKWGMETFNLPGDTIRAPRTKADAADFKVSWFPYNLEEHARDFEYEEKEKQEYARLGERVGAAELFNMERDGVMFTEDQLQLGREKKQGDLLRSNAIPGETLAVGARWDVNTTDIPAAARFARKEIRRKTGKIMNTVLLPFDVDDVVMWHPTVKEYLGTATRQFVDLDLIRRVFRVENVITAAMIYNLGTEDAPNLVDIWGKDVIFAYVDPAPQGQRSQRRQSLAYTFRYARTNNEAATPSPVQGEDQSMPVLAWYDPNTETHIRRVKYEEKTQIVSANCGYVFRGVIA